MEIDRLELIFILHFLKENYETNCKTWDFIDEIMKKTLDKDKILIIGITD